MFRRLIGHDRDDVRIVLAERCAARGRAADLDFRPRLATVSLDDHDLAIALALAGLAGCGGRSHIDRESLPAPGLPELSALAELPTRAVSAVTYCQYGEEFYRFYTRQVQAVGSRAVFSPDAPDGGIGAEGMAYTLYRFDIDSGAALNELRVAWEQAPPGGAVWIGLSDWQRGCWE